MSPLLADVADNHTNNFNALRLAAALGVFVSHLFSVYGMNGVPGVKLLGYVGVNVFFIISGFLVCKSVLHRRSNRAFIKARLLRVFPALIMVVFLTTWVLGPLLSNLSFSEYFSAPAVAAAFQYFFQNTMGIFYGINYRLPEVFNSGVVNANLWTLPYELQLYGLLLVTAVVTQSKSVNSLTFRIVWCVITIVSLLLYLPSYVYHQAPIELGFSYSYLRFSAMFGCGVLAYSFRQYIRLTAVACLVMLLCVLLASQNRFLFVSLFYTGLAYLVLCLAYLPLGRLRVINTVGDYSYGLYVFAYPLQKLCMNLWPNVSFLTFSLVSFSLTLVFSVASWWLVESPALRLKLK